MLRISFRVNLSFLTMISWVLILPSISLPLKPVTSFFTAYHCEEDKQKVAVNEATLLPPDDTLGPLDQIHV